jgi:SNF2 family DNA or RNA helicase
VPARLKQGEGVLYVKLGGTSQEFAAQLARVKVISGKRYNPEHPEHGKVWEIPDTDEALLKCVHTVEPEMPAGLLARVRKARQEQAAELTTALPDDAELLIPWAPLLAPKQRAGVEFMVDQGHTIQGDDMGGGKTVQSISTVYEKWLRENGETPFTGQVLGIAPNSVLNHWKRELGKWLLGIGLKPSDLLHVTDDPEEQKRLLPEWKERLYNWGVKMGVDPDNFIVVNGKTAKKREEQLAAVASTPGSWGLVNWEKLQKRVKLVGDSKEKGPLQKIKWYAVIADEAHRAKNHDSQQGRALFLLRAPIQIAATGTPVMNNPGELYSLLRWLRPEQYTSYWAFYYNYTEFYKGYEGRDVVIGVKNADDLRFELSTIMVRRTKREIHPDIPEPHEPIIYECAMTTEQAKLYAAAEKEFWLEIAQEAPEVVQEALESPDPLEVLKLRIPNAATRTIRMRQIATSPAVLGGPDSSGKLNEMTATVTASGVETPWVLFAWYQPSVELVAGRLREAGIDARYFHGESSGAEERAAMATAFQNEEFPAIVCSIGAGGVGIDLFRAQHVGFVEEDWVPGINQQAVDRLDRKGQLGHVQPHIWRSAETVDTGNIAPKLSTKKLITETILGAS